MIVKKIVFKRSRVCWFLVKSVAFAANTGSDCNEHEKPFDFF